MSRRKRKGNYKRGRPPLSPIHYAAVELLAGKYGRKSCEEIAELIGVNRRTLYRWRQRRDFDNALTVEIRRTISERFAGHRPSVMDIANSGDIAELIRILQANGFAVG
ncbi:MULTISPECIES: phBC6A51 family helix-turn-helix protein [unclassified Paenibacillus]|uniref:phBC6A51 family helix-turn-helix protein n=1 Tax=unclassified Paenibacillus TaxID=185978 RepID=UPI0036287491